MHNRKRDTHLTARTTFSMTRRRFLEGAVATGSIASVATRPLLVFSRELRQEAANVAGASLSRQLARWAAGLRYEDLPPEVVDRAKRIGILSRVGDMMRGENRVRQRRIRPIM